MKVLDDFNQAAIDISGRLTALREATQAEQGKQSRDKLFPDYNRVGFGIALEWERMGNQPVSDDLLDKATALGVEFEHIGLTLGTVLHNVDLSQPLGSEWVSFLRQALLERKVIFFHEQNLSEDEQVAFARYFGELDAFPFGKSGQNPFVLTLDHDDQNPGNQNGWHTDVTWMEKPSLGSVAQTMTVPPVGGDTLFSDSHAVYLGLDPNLQQRLQHVAGVNDYRVLLGGGGKHALPEELLKEVKSRIPFGVSHPIFRTHPETGKTGLFLHPTFLRHDSLYDTRNGEPLGETESRKVVAELKNQHARQEYICRFQWQQGSVAFWDNRAVQHYATSDYYPHKRILRRVTISGDRPFYNPEKA